MMPLVCSASKVSGIYGFQGFESIFCRLREYGLQCDEGFVLGFEVWDERYAGLPGG